MTIRLEGKTDANGRVLCMLCNYPGSFVETMKDGKKYRISSPLVKVEDEKISGYVHKHCVEQAKREQK